MKRVLIVGGGTGNTFVANALDKRRFEVTLLSQSPKHVFQPALLYVAFRNAKPDFTRDERRLLARHVRFVEETVTRIDLQDRTATTGSGHRYDYDSVVVGTGVTTDPSQIPGLSEVNAQFGDYHTNVPQAQKVWASLDAFQGGTIALGQSSQKEISGFQSIPAAA